jgi:hypothetical protein
MTRPPLRHLPTWGFVLLLTVWGLVSASMMAPERSDAAEARIALMGMTAEDLCGLHDDGDHRCPFCHLVPEAFVPAPAGMALTLLPYDAWQQATDLHRAAQARDHARSPRAPPLFT